MSASAEEEDRSMARRKKHSPEEIVAKLRSAQIQSKTMLLGQALIAAVARADGPTGWRDVGGCHGVHLCPIYGGSRPSAWHV
jgi:hypothetical protein